MQPGRTDPFFSRFGCGTAFLLTAILGVVLALMGGIPFSPGPVTAAQTHGQSLGGYQSHADFEGRCEQCHAPWQRATADRCQQCHVPIADEIALSSGLHGHLADTQQCHTCHTDHQGADAAIINWTPVHIDHSRVTDFSLARHAVDYAGADLACTTCHQAYQYSGERVDCVTCHATRADAQQAAQANADMAAHVDLFGSDCLGCHDGRDTMAQFTHDAVFPLLGEHDTADCAACHSGQQFAGTSQLCSDCHGEPALHAGRFGLACVRCHTPTAWAPAKLTQHTFPLDHGASASSCKTCHDVSYVVFDCYSCHEHQADAVAVTHLAAAIEPFDDCMACHAHGVIEEQSAQWPSGNAVAFIRPNQPRGKQ